jgi:hypothetical protein
MYIKMRANKTCQIYFIHSVKVAQASLAAKYLGTVVKKMYIKVISPQTNFPATLFPVTVNILLHGCSIQASTKQSAYKVTTVKHSE